MTARASTVVAAGRSRRSAARSHSPPGSRGRRPGPARWPWRYGRGRARRRSARGRARTRWPAALDRAVAWRRVQRHRCPCRPPRPAKSRWTPPVKWPVLPDERKGDHGRARTGRPPSGSCWRSRAGPRWPVRSASATSRGVPARGPVVVSLRSRRCSCRGRNVEFPPRVNVSGRYRKWLCGRPCCCQGSEPLPDSRVGPGVGRVDVRTLRHLSGMDGAVSCSRPRYGASLRVGLVIRRVFSVAGRIRPATTSSEPARATSHLKGRSASGGGAKRLDSTGAEATSPHHHLPT